MPVKLPDATSLGPRPVPAAMAGFARYRPEGGGEQATGRADLAIGRSLTQAGIGLDRAFEAEWERQDRIAAEDAYNRLRVQQLELTVGKEGFTQVRGADAVHGDMMQTYPERLKTAAEGIREDLKSNRQKEIFTRLSQTAAIQFKEDLLRHSVRERDAYAAQVYKATVENEVNAATARWQDPEAVKITLGRINEAITHEGERLGWDAERVKVERSGAASAVHAAVIGQALASNQHVYAKNWYDAHKDAIDPRTATMVQRAVVDAQQKDLYNGYTQALTRARSSSGALASLEKQISGDSVLDDTRKTALLARIASRQDVLERRAIAQHDHRIRLVARNIDQLNTQINKGYDVSPEQLGGLIDAAKGTGLEGEVAAIAKHSKATASFRNSPPPSQATQIVGLERAVRANPSAGSIAMLESYRRIHSEMTSQLASDPYKLAAGKGWVEPVQLDLSQPPQEVAGAWKMRVEQARLIADEYGAPIRPLMGEEKDALVVGLRRSGPQGKAEFFAQLSRTFGDDVDGYKAVLAQIAPDDPVTAFAGVAGAQFRSGLAAEALRGQTLLDPPVGEDGKKPKGQTWPLPSEAKMRDRFARNVGDAFASHGQYMRGVFETAKALYTARAEKAGLLDTEDVDVEIWDKAVEDAGGKVSRWAGQRVLVPATTHPDVFADTVTRHLEHALVQGRIDPKWSIGQLEDQPLEAIAEGVYRVKVGDGYLIGSDGKQVLVDLNGPTPYIPSGQGRVRDVKQELVASDARYGELGLMRRPDGRASSEISITVQDPLSGRWVNIPTLVRGQVDVEALLRGQQPSVQQVRQAVLRAQERVKAGAKLPTYPTEAAASRAARERSEAVKMRPYQ